MAGFDFFERREQRGERRKERGKGREDKGEWRSNKIILLWISKLIDRNVVVLWSSRNVIYFEFGKTCIKLAFVALWPSRNVTYFYFEMKCIKLAFVVLWSS